ncbi:hypothetical protein J2847_001107 [Azospirillum agricola]|uniref:hypothetical protein n=1 Tax=Azospirillum agricola TaxID=1720247 RepID=UPI001AE7F051|nr:hypothetical protein [Azospirillum agricola]MBP2227825.1 hypothetical protein [Azospirillum agricola]
MPDTHDTARTTADASAPLLSFPDDLTSEAASMLLGGNVGGLKAVQEKLAAALAGQGVSGTDAGRLADGWVQSFASGMGSAASPEAAIAEASRITGGTAARMAQAVQDAAGLTGEQKLATALAQGQDVARAVAQGTATTQGTATQGTATQGSADGTPSASLATALFDGVMDQLARPAGSADPMAALAQALNAPAPAGPAAATVDLSPAEKLTAALASGVAVTDAVKTLGGDGAGLFAETLERALSSGADAASAVAAATERAEQGGAQTQSILVEQSGGDRLMTALAAGSADALRGAGEGAAFASVLNDALARGTAPDAALGASARAQADMAAQESAAGVAPKPADALVASLASGRNVTETVKSFAAAAGLDAAGGFGHALGTALSAGQEVAGALGAARQDVAAASAMAAESARGVKGDGLVAALASGQNVQQAVQAVGGGGAFGDALGRALAEGRSPGQALAAARQAADMAQQNSQASEVPVSPENQALADLAAPANPEAHAEGEKDGKADAKGEGKATADGAKAEPATQVADSGEKTDAGKEGEKDAGKDEAKDGKDAGDKAADAPASANSSSSENGSPRESAAPSKSADLAGPAMKPVSFATPDGGNKATTSGDSTAPTPATNGGQPASTAPATKTVTADAFAVAAQTQQRIVQSVTQAAENAASNSGTTPGAVTPAIPGAHHAPSPILAAGFDAAALAKALAVAEGTAAPAGFTVFHLIEAMFRPGEAGSSVVGVAVVANGNSALGVWQYSADGSSWLAIGTVSDASALILPGNALLRFLPAAGASGTAPALGLRAVNDEWAGGFGTLAALTGTGGTSPLSAEVGQLSLEVTPVNGAPVATGLTATLDAVTEDSANPAGASVSSLFAALFSDPTDAVFGAAGDGFAGVAVVADASTAAQGEWQYWNGSAWTAIGAVSAGNALLLSADAKLRFLPAADWNGTTPALTLRLVDDSEGVIASGSRVSLDAGTGGSTRYSAETIALTGTVTPVNDAPVATGTTATLTAVAEDTADPAGATVSSLFGALFSDPRDALGGTGADRLAGVAIVGGASDPAQGVWQYWNGSAWTAIGAVSEGNALVVLATDKLRFLPAADWNGTPPSLTARLIDSSATLGASGARIDLGSLGVGGATPYSATTITLDSRVTAVNDAPVATGTTATLATIAEDAANPAGATVSTLFAALFSDPADTVSGGSAANGFAGVAVVGNAAGAAQGLWQYWTGGSWADVGAASAGNALLLSADAKLRFLPAADWNGTTPALTLRLVDDSDGAIVSGSRTALPGSGGSTRYSAETIALTGAVTAVNDAPVATGTTATLPTIAEDTADPAGATVTSLFGALFSDAADAVAGGSTANGFAGVAIVGNAATPAEGVWQYWTGTAWAAVGAVSAGSALVVAAADKLRFVPAADWNGTTPALTVRLIEQSAATVATGGHVDLTTTGVGGSTAYGADTIALTGTVTPVNDAPQVTAGTSALTAVKGVAVAVTGLSVSDIDAGSTPLIVTLTAGHGTLTLDGGGLDAVITGNGTDSVTVRATLAVINSLLGATNGLLYKATSYTGADSIHILVDDQGGGGAGGPLTATASVAVTVKPPNASPVLADTDLQLSTAGEALTAPGAGTAGIAVSKLVGLNGTGPANVTDGDSDALAGIALVGTNESYGHWWYSTDGGATWHLVGTVNDSDSALLLGANDRLYFQPNASVPGTVNAALTIRAWDQTTGTHGTKVAVDTTDGSAFSSATDSVTLHPGVLIPNGSFDNGLTGWTSTGGSSVGATGDGHEGTVTSASGKTPTELEDFLGLAHGSIAAKAEVTPSAGHAMKLASTVTVTEATTLTFHWSFTFTDSGSYQDFAFVSVNGLVTILAKAASGSGTFTATLAAGSTLSLGFGASDTGDNSVNPILTVDNIKLTTVASDPIVLDLTGNGLALRSLADGVRFDVTGDGVADQTGWVGAGNALLVRDENHNGRIDDARELVSEQFGKGFNSSLEALASLDDNHDGRLDAADAAFATLQVWQDHNADGVSQTGELRTLAEAGIRSIATTWTASDATLAGNRILGTTSVTMADGSTHAAAGVAFDVKPAEAAQVQVAQAQVAQIQVAAQVPNQSQPQPFTGGHDGTDFAALLSSGLGLPNAAPVAVDIPALHGTGWTAEVHDPNGHHPQPHDPSGVHASGNA